MIETWRKIQSENFTCLDALCHFLLISASDQKKLHSSPEFILNLPRRLAEKMEKGNIADPLFRQFVPLIEEMEKRGGQNDPVGDQKVRFSNKLLKKYNGRALILATSACAMHCRYCFRQNFPYEKVERGFKRELEWLLRDPSIDEVILSGGDPLSLSTEILRNFFEDLEAIPHLKRLRIHSRFPIGIPERIDEPFLQLLEKSSLQIFFVLHCNHPNELGEDLFEKITLLQKLGIPVLNQAVLLKRVNDDEETLKRLFLELANRGVFAYYLHQLDRLDSALHFEVEEKRGHELIRYLEVNLPGYAVPKYVKEVSGEPSKTPLHSF